MSADVAEMSDDSACFVCNEPTAVEGVRLSQKQTQHSHTQLPDKLSNLMGVGFVVVYTEEDRVCQRCLTLLNRCDQLETDLRDVTEALRGLLNKKYHLVECDADDSVADESGADSDVDVLPSSQTSIADEASNTDVIPMTLPDHKTSPMKVASTNPKPVYSCPTCNYATSNQLTFVSHQRKCKGLSYGCTMCERKFENPKQVRGHIMSVHLSTWPCHFCGESFADQTEYTSHMKIHLSNVSYDPPRPLKELNVHRTELGDFECNVCAFRTGDKASFHQHVRGHVARPDRRRPAHKCKQCDVTCLSAAALRAHVESHETVFSPVSMEPCSSGEENAEPVPAEGDPLRLSELDVPDYERRAGETGQHECRVCLLTFVDRAVLELHERTHVEAASGVVKEEDAEEDQTSTDGSEEEDLEDMLERMHSGPATGSQIQLAITKVEETSCPSWVDTEPNASVLEVLSEKTQDTNQGLLDDDAMNDLSEDATLGSEVVIGGTESLPRLSSKQNIADIMRLVEKKKMSSVEVENSWDLDSFVGDSQIISQDSCVPLDTSNGNVPLSEPTEIKRYVCAMCGYQSNDQVALRKHFRDHRENKSYSCGICRRQLSSSQKLASHLRSHQRSPGPLACTLCHETCADKFHLHQHVQEKHPKEKGLYACQYCDVKFALKKSLKAHEEKHPESFSVKCTVCGGMFLRQKHLADHMASEHRDPHCRYCGKEIMKPKALRNHELRHTRDDDSHDCAQCDKKFKTKTGLRHHEAVHTGNYTYSCDFCGRGFMSRMMMVEHRSKHTKEERYICDVCGMKFSFQSTYWIHRKWHDNPYPYKCSFCNRMFRHSSLLAVHKRKHTGERPYQCPYCPLSFPVSGTLKRHLILHTGKYPFSCEDCNRGFTTKHKYMTHRAKQHEDYTMLNERPVPSEYKMVIRDPPHDSESQVEALLGWERGEEGDGEQSFMFKMGVGEGEMEEIILQQSSELIPCTVITDSVMAVDDMGNSQMVQIVMDESSQPTGTVSEESVLLSDIWSYQ